MATAWVARSLSCKSSAVADDVYTPPLLPKKHPPPPVKSAVPPAFPKLMETPRSRELQEWPVRKKKKKATSSKPGTKSKKLQQPAQLAPSPVRPSSGFLAMTELPEGHSSRRVVELIFASGWGGPHAPEVEALFRVRSTARAVARFEDARRAAMLAPGADARCGADGNEMMRFHCRGAEAGGEVICAAVATTGPSSAAVRTFASCGAADADAGAGGGASGRRGMLVCRVIAGRVRRAADPACEHDSVDAGGGELVVLDSRAVLPCFLVIYKVNNQQASELC